MKKVKEIKSSNDYDNDFFNDDDCYVTRKSGGNVYEVFIDDYITEPKNYRNLFEVLANAEEVDEVVFMINSYGGSADTMIQILSAMRQTKAKTTTKVFAAGSAATYIALAADNIIIDEFATFMFHGMIWSHMGSVSNGKAKFDHCINSMNMLNKTYLSMVLSDEEIELISKGDHEIWITGAQVIERMTEKGLVQEDSEESSEDE